MVVVARCGEQFSDEATSVRASSLAGETSAEHVLAELQARISPPMTENPMKRLTEWLRPHARIRHLYWQSSVSLQRRDRPAGHASRSRESLVDLVLAVVMVCLVAAWFTVT